MNTIYYFLLFILFCYFLGCLSTGYYLVRLLTSKDIRDSGSKGTGATNAGRLLGKKGFIITFILDVLKGILIAWLCKYLHFNSFQSLFCIIALACGHIWPLQLQFRGGKGISVLIGFFIIWNPLILLTSILIGLIPFLIIKKYTISGLIGMISFPIFGLLNNYDCKTIFLLFLFVFIIYIAHYKNIREFIYYKASKKDDE